MVDRAIRCWKPRVLLLDRSKNVNRQPLERSIPRVNAKVNLPLRDHDESSGFISCSKRTPLVQDVDMGEAAWAEQGYVRGLCTFLLILL